MDVQHSILDEAQGTGLVTSVAGVDARVGWDDPLIGEWWIDPSKCYYDRPHPFPPDPEGWTPLNRGGVRPTSGAGGLGIGKWTYAVEGAGVRTFYYFGNGPDSPAQPIMQYFATWDGTPWADPHSTLLPGQLCQVWRLDPRLIVRLVLDNSKPELPRWEWAVWASSTSAASFACTSWDSSAPDRHNLQVFDKHIGPVFGSAGKEAPSAGPSRSHRTEAPLENLIGCWRLDADKSSFLRNGQDGDGQPGARARLERRFDPADILVDGVERRRGNSRATQWVVADELMVGRSRSAEETIWSLYALSYDSKMLAVTSWDQSRPADRDIEVYWRDPRANGGVK